MPCLETSTAIMEIGLLKVGKFDLKVTFYSEPKGKGDKLETQMIAFEVVDAAVEDIPGLFLSVPEVLTN